MYCANCGTELNNPNQKFCHNCGKENLISSIFPQIRPESTQNTSKASALYQMSYKKGGFYSTLYSLFAISSFLIGLLSLILIGPIFLLTRPDLWTLKYYRWRATVLTVMITLHSGGLTLGILSKGYIKKAGDEGGVLGIFGIILNAIGLCTVLITHY
ncbi:MAG: zinc ribbon domain-containing protein [Promethearchaeota archaeon]|nr:MAG: zinc ribbon domain-containing protein [Candidatus Lokiarchaeota archaeon]